MAALAWLLIPLVAAIGAGLWGSWAAPPSTATEPLAGTRGSVSMRRLADAVRGDGRSSRATDSAAT